MVLINNTKPRDYYVYLHRKRTNGEVFYVGKGFGPRYKSTWSRNKHWFNTAMKHGVIIEIVQDGLQEWYAFELESQLVDFYGRKNLNHGTLVNAADGGGEMINRVSTPEFRELISELKADQTSYTFRNSINGETFVGRRKDFMSKYPDVPINSVFHRYNVVKGWSVDGVSHNLRRSKSLGDNDVAVSVYKLKHTSGELFIGTRKEFKLKYNKNINRLFMERPRRKIAGWSLLTE